MATIYRGRPEKCAAGLAVKAPTSAKPKTQVRRHPFLHKHELGRLASGRR